MAKKGSIRFSKEEVTSFKKAIDGLCEFADLLSEKKLHRLQDKKEEIVKNLQPIKPHFQEFLEDNEFEIKYPDCLVEYFFDYPPDSDKKSDPDEESKSTYKLKKRPLRMLSDVLNRDDGELDIPVRPISLENLFGTIEMELIGISNHVIDKDSAMYVNNKYAEETYMACSARIGRLIKKLKEISEFVSDNSKSYQLAENKMPGQIGEGQTSGKAGDKIKTKKNWISNFFWKLYEKTLKVVVDSVLEKLWPK